MDRSATHALVSSRSTRYREVVLTSWPAGPKLGQHLPKTLNRSFLKVVSDIKIKVGVMGSASDLSTLASDLPARAQALAEAIAARDVILLTGATTGLIYAVGKAAQAKGAFHVGISPGHSQREHAEYYRLPTDACDMLVYTGFGLKGRNVVLVRSCDIVLFISGAMGSLNEFTIAHDEGKVIGCLRNTGGVADEADYLLKKFSHQSGARVFQDSDPHKLLDACLGALAQL